MRRESQEVNPRSKTVIELDIAGLIINPSKMEVAPQGCLNVIIQKTKIKLIE